MVRQVQCALAMFMLIAVAGPLSAARGVVTIVASEPPSGAIDARQPHLPNDPAARFGWDSVVLTFDGAADGLTPTAFTLSETGGDGAVPAITQVEAVDATSVRLTLSEPIEPGTWTVVTHVESGTTVRLGYLPGDVDGDGVATPSDIIVLIDQLNGVRAAAPPFSTDLDRTGATDATDIDTASALLGGAGSFAAWINVSIADGSSPPPPPGAGGDGAVVELVPQTPGPYLPAQIVTVDILMRRAPAGDHIPLRLATLDTRASDPGFTLTTPLMHPNGIEFWDFGSTPFCQASPAACGVGYVIFLFAPNYNMTYTGLTENLDAQVIIPADGSSVRIAVMEVEVPPASGTYVLDVMNFASPNTSQTAKIIFDFFTPTTWTAITGELTGGTLDMVVLPGDPAGCCTPPEAPQGEGCTDMIREDCEAIVDGEGHSAVWQDGLMCGEGDQHCVHWVCQYAEGACDVTHGTSGCNDATCCDLICDQDPFCCLWGWDSVCVERALSPTSGCQFPTGACCDRPIGDCQDDVTATECGDSEWHEAVACADLNPPCFIATGACCVYDGLCTIRSPAECNSFGGDYLGDETTCEGDADGDQVDGSCGDLCPLDPDKLDPGACGCGVPDTDSDNDTVPDCNDGCPNDPGKTEPGVCGCGVADTDSDNDTVPDCNDGCPDDPGKTEPGVCGCGVPDTDSDNDTVPDCNDGCPDDPGKTEPGVCGCGVADVDSDGDTVLDCDDGCPNDAGKIEPGACGCGVADTDSDGDTVPDCHDQCPGEDDLPDSDGDGIPDCIMAPVPAVSSWGLLILALMLLVGAKTYLRLRRAREST